MDNQDLLDHDNYHTFTNDNVWIVVSHCMCRLFGCDWMELCCRDAMTSLLSRLTTETADDFQVIRFVQDVIHNCVLHSDSCPDVLREVVRSVNECLDDIGLTCNVLIGWLNSCICDPVSFGLCEESQITTQCRQVLKQASVVLCHLVSGKSIVRGGSVVNDFVIDEKKRDVLIGVLKKLINTRSKRLANVVVKSGLMKDCVVGIYDSICGLPIEIQGLQHILKHTITITNENMNRNVNVEMQSVDTMNPVANVQDRARQALHRIKSTHIDTNDVDVNDVNVDVNMKWRECRSEDGQVYYYNVDTGETSWTIPSQ